MLVFTLIPVSAQEEAIGICPINSCLICQDDAATEPEEQQAGISWASLVTWLVNGISAQFLRDKDGIGWLLKLSCLLHRQQVYRNGPQWSHDQRSEGT